MHTRKILIVDDEPTHLEAIIDVFEETGHSYRILQAFTGKEAFKIAEKETPDLIITDWEMPGISGIDLINQLKRNENTRDIPIIMCTGVMTSSENLETALKAGAVDYIRKPIDKIELIARTKANLHLADNYTRIKKLIESKDRIYTIIAHDLGGPVGSIKAFLEIILSHQSDYKRKRLLEDIALLVKQSSAAYYILENLLTWANSQRDNVDFNPKRQKINLAIKNNIDLLENIANKKSIVVSNETKDNLMAVYDLNQISTVIRNLVANAIKFTPKNGKITVNVEQNKSDTLVTVTDTGIGISPDRVEKLFDTTTFETTYGTNNEKGSGLGLKLCNYFIEQHNGKIWVESEADKGSKFMFSIPKKL